MTVTLPARALTTATVTSGPDCASASASASAPANQPIDHRRQSHGAHFGSWAFRHAAANPRIPRSLSKPRPARRPLAAVGQSWSGDDNEGAMMAQPTMAIAQKAASRIEAADARADGYDDDSSGSDDGGRRPRGGEEVPDLAPTARNPQSGAPDRLPTVRVHLAEGADTGRIGLRLAQVKQALIESFATSAAAHKPAGPAPGNQYLLLPLVLLNAARPRTAAQSEAARNRLALLARATIGGKA